MMKWRWYRSVIFWAGIFVMASLTWAWRDSVKIPRSLEWGRWEIDHWASGLAISKPPKPPQKFRFDRTFWDPNIFNGSMPPEQIHSDAGPRSLEKMRWAKPGFCSYPEIPVDDSRWPPPKAMKAGEDLGLRQILMVRWGQRLATGPAGSTGVIPGGWLLFLPYWLLIAAFAALWFLVLLWRSKRKTQG